MNESLISSLPASTAYLEMGGRRIRIESFASDPQARIAVVVLHGANGLRYANPAIYGAIQLLTVNGMAAHLVHYFERTGTAYADDATIHASFHLWSEVVAAAIARVRKTQNSQRLALFGHSLGGYLAAAQVTRNPQVEAAVILSGGLDMESARTVTHTAPVLILHGGSDTRVPVGEARRLEAALVAAGARPECHIYAGEGHQLQMASYVDAIRRALEFLRKHLA